MSSTQKKQKSICASTAITQQRETHTMQLAIDLPSDLVVFQGIADTRQELQTSYALWLFQRERITLAKAAEVAGVSLYEFMSLCKSNQVPVIDISREELTAELEELSKA